MRWLKVAAAAFALGSMSIPQTALAASITFQFSGHVTHVDPILAGTFDEGDDMTASYTFESETPCSLGCAGSTIHTYFAALSGGSLSVGDYSATYSDTEIELSVVNDEALPGGPRDAYQADILGLVGPLVGGLAPLAFDITLLDTTATVFSDLELALDLDLSDFSDTAPGWAFGRNWILEFGEFGPPNTFILGEVTGLSVTVPEPSTLWSVGLGILGIVAARSRCPRSRATA